MSAGERALHEVEPREQVGPATGEAFEYQYHQGAAQALSLLDDTNVVCIYCEWHDDYVTEAAANGGYQFHQVKTRQKSKGPWRLAEFFGLQRRKKGQPTPAAHADSVFAHLWDHTAKFGDRCVGFVFVTDAGADSDLEALLAEAKTAQSPSILSVNVAETFTMVRDALAQTFADLTGESLLAFLAKTIIQDGVGAVRDLNGCRVLITNRILEASEVDLAMSEARKIGADLVSAVRERSHKKLTTLPATVDELRTSKGLVIDNVLRLLSLSTEGYRQLKVGGRASVVALSRLHRLCKRNNVPDNLIPDLCKFKTAWDGWWIDQRHLVDDADYLALKAECAGLLRSHSEGHLPIEQLVAQAKTLAEKFEGKLTSSEPVTAELIVGFVVSLAVEAEA